MPQGSDIEDRWGIARAAGAGLALALLATPLAAQPVPTPPSTPLKWGPHLDLEGKLGNNRDLGEADFFLPLLQDSRSLLFGNLKGRLDDNASREGNFGLGVRHMLDAGWNIGAYGYYDRRRTETHNWFSQATFGLEALSLDWDLRANAYLPLGRRTHDLGGSGGGSTASLSGTTVTITTAATQIREERSLIGFDAEIGWRVPLFGAEAGQQLRLYGGAYRFYANEVDPVQGPRGRVEMVFNEVPVLWSGSRLALGGEVQHDGPRGKTGFASARLRLPLQLVGESASRLTPLERRMADPVVRDIDIVAQTRSVTTGTASVETATQVSGGAALVVLDSGSTTGANLPTAITNAGANSTVILAGTFNTTTLVTLAANQTVMGAGSLTVQSASGKTATLTTAAATINSTAIGNTAAVDMATGSTLTGMTITQAATGGGNPQAFGVRANNVNNATISNNTITVTSTTGAGTAYGVRLVDGSNLVARNNTVSVTTSGGGSGNALALQILDTGTATSATISGNTLSASSNGGTSQAANVAGAVAGITLTGSTGNVRNSGACASSGTITGTISFTNFANCP